MLSFARELTPEEVEELFASHEKFLYEALSRSETLRADAEKSGEWSAYVDAVHAVYENFESVLDRDFEHLPPSVKLELATGMHIHNGDSMRGVYSALEYCAYEGITNPESLPESLRSKPWFYVYRAGEEDIENAADRISWTTSYDVAHWFAYEYNKRHAKAIYRAKISPYDVLLYTNNRNEQEVMQCGAVFDVELIETVKNA